MSCKMSNFIPTDFIPGAFSLDAHHTTHLYARNTSRALMEIALHALRFSGKTLISNGPCWFVVNRLVCAGANAEC